MRYSPFDWETYLPYSPDLPNPEVHCQSITISWQNPTPLRRHHGYWKWCFVSSFLFTFLWRLRGVRSVYTPGRFFNQSNCRSGIFVLTLQGLQFSQNFAKSAKDWRSKSQKNTGLVGTVFCMEVSSKSAKNDRFTTSFLFGIHGSKIMPKMPIFCQSNAK